MYLVDTPPHDFCFRYFQNANTIIQLFGSFLVKPYLERNILWAVSRTSHFFIPQHHHLTLWGR